MLEMAQSNQYIRQKVVLLFNIFFECDKFSDFLVQYIKSR